MNDNINPAHYQFGKYEPIKVINDWKLNFNKGNAIKYIARAGRKEPLTIEKEIEDLKKAKKYIEFEIERLEEGAD